MEDRHLLNSQRGATLMEVLVAVVVLSVGLLGVAGLQTTGINAGNGAFYKTQASVLAADMADRIRANPQAQNAYTPGLTPFDTGSSAIPGDPGCLSTGCSPAALAQYDLHQWSQYFLDNDDDGQPVLPEARGVISRGINDEFIVSVLWRQRRISETAHAQTTQCSVPDQAAEIVCVEMRFW